jgi:DNA-binding NarL/FixJ family response regulator
MSGESELSWEQTQALINTLVLKRTGKYLSDIEIEVLHGSWEGKSYEEIAEQLFRSVSYINKDVGYRLWKKLCRRFCENGKNSMDPRLKQYLGQMLIFL